MEKHEMKSMVPGLLGAAIVIGGSMAVLAHATDDVSARPALAANASAIQAGSTGNQKVMIVGCVMREEDYRKAHNLSRGGAVGTGVGTGNEFILANASTSAAAAPGAQTDKGTGANYEVTGPNEGQLSQHVGKRVEISGMLKPAEVGAAGTTGGPTAGAPPRGVDVVSQDLKLRELEVTTVRAASGTCQQ
jgi:hypothetical protein